MSDAPYPIVDIKSKMDDLEQVGTKEKYWFRHNGVKWLLKVSRAGTGEHWAEKLAEQICIKLCIPHAAYELARWKNSFAVISESMITDGVYRLALGNEILLSRDKNYPELNGASKYVKRKEHTIYRVMGVLDSMNIKPPPEFKTDLEMSALDVFLGYLMLDALIGNQDRHDENWAVLLCNAKDKHDCLAPTFDHASGFACTEKDVTREKRLNTKDVNYTVEAFSKKARSGFYKKENDDRTLPAIDVFRIVANRQKTAANYWLAKLEELTDQFIDLLLERFSNEIMSDITKEFTRRILIANREALLCLKQKE